jgi:hypothetical protein
LSGANEVVSLISGGHAISKRIDNTNAVFHFKLELVRKNWFQIIIDQKPQANIGQANPSVPFCYYGYSQTANVNGMPVDMHTLPTTTAKLIIKNSVVKLEINGKLQNDSWKIPPSFYIIADICIPNSKITIL